MKSDSVNNVGFAKFLFDHKLYDLSSQEYERLVYIYPNEDSHVSQLLSCYRKLNNFEAIESKSSTLNLQNGNILKEYLLSLSLNDQSNIARLVFEEKKENLKEDVKNHLNIDIDVMDFKYESALKKYNQLQLKEPDYYSLINEGKNIKKKSPGLAGILSGIIPGSGRVYAKDTKDGIISFVFVSATAFQAIRRFQKNGSSSVGGWIYSGFAAGFYIANIYGSIISAKDYNKNQKFKINERAKRFIDNYYSI